MLQPLLEGLEYCVIPAANGTEALLAAEHNHIDLILTDFSLPDMTGLTVVRDVRQLGNPFAPIPVIMLTAFDGFEYSEVAVKPDCDAFFTKPVDFEILETTIERLLQEAKARDTVARLDR
jgi:two-component system response regulator HydG